ncbi:MAG TPA: hypothetical protein VM597_22495 [Gemmataceae bacterium]|jgi:hypothetical protein|nr:hypothetical protein [Gemmataceae bacterium]
MITAQMRQFPLLARTLAQRPTLYVQAGKAADKLAARAIAWDTDRVSKADKRPPGIQMLFEYEFVDGGPGGKDVWHLGVLLRRLRPEWFDPGRRLAGHDEVWQADQFMVLRAHTRPAGGETRLPLGRLIHAKMVWHFWFAEGGRRVRTKATFSPDPAEAPFGVRDRVLTTDADRYFPLACPWPVLSTVGLVNEHRLGGHLAGADRFVLDW